MTPASLIPIIAAPHLLQPTAASLLLLEHIEAADHAQEGQNATRHGLGGWRLAPAPPRDAPAESAADTGVAPPAGGSGL
jgi:hypothetical protein